MVCDYVWSFPPCPRSLYSVVEVVEAVDVGVVVVASEIPSDLGPCVTAGGVEVEVAVAGSRTAGAKETV